MVGSRVGSPPHSVKQLVLRFTRMDETDHSRSFEERSPSKRDTGVIRSRPNLSRIEYNMQRPHSAVRGPAAT